MTVAGKDAHHAALRQRSLPRRCITLDIRAKWDGVVTYLSDSSTAPHDPMTEPEREQPVNEIQQALHADRPDMSRLRVCSFESRRADDMRSLIERQGGVATVAPSMQEVPLEENAEAFDFAESLFADRIDVVVFMTGVGARTLLETLQTRYDRQKFFQALQKCRTIVRGPKPTAVLREWNVLIDHRAPEPNTWRELLEVIDREVDASGKMIAVQEYGVPNDEFYEALERRGATVLRVPVYRWALPEDIRPLQDAVRATIDGKLDVLLITSANQVTNVLEVARGENKEAEWIAAANQAVIASIGPTASEALRSAGLPVDVEASPPKMGQLVRQMFREAPEILAKKRSRQP